MQTHLSASHPSSLWNLVDRYLNLTGLLRITALCNRATNIFLSYIKGRSLNPSKGSIITKELEDALFYWIKATQTAYFNEEIRQIKTASRFARNDPLLRLAPFLDPARFLRISGRLKHSILSYDEKHPLILFRES